jgi:ATP-dependent RNA helicase DDX35
MRDVTAVDPEWLPELAPHFYRTNDRSGNERAPEDAVVF